MVLYHTNERRARRAIHTPLHFHFAARRRLQSVVYTPPSAAPINETPSSTCKQFRLTSGSKYVEGAAHPPCDSLNTCPRFTCTTSHSGRRGTGLYIRRQVI